MKLHVRIHKDISTPELRTMLESRARFALTRLSPRLREVTVVATRETARDGGSIICRVSGVLEGVGTLHVSRKDPNPRTAIDNALDRFRRATVRTFARRMRHTPRPSANIFAAPTLDLTG